MKEEAINIYYSDEVSYGLPEAKYAEMHFMSMTLNEAYRVYLSQSTSERKMARSTFSCLKPDNVRTISETPLHGCKCEYCQNLGMLRSTLIGLGFKGIPKGHSSSIEVTWCEFRRKCTHERDGECTETCTIHKDDFPSKNCVMQKCDLCGTANYRNTLIESNPDLMKKRGKVYWKQWALKELERMGKNGKPIKRMALEEHKGTYEEILNEYITQLDSMSLHQFNKLWQLKNFNETLRNLQVGQVLFVHDFSQNLLMYIQDEASGAHWDHEQVTIHPTVAFYVCETCGKVVKEEIIHITSDKKHDVHSVHVFQDKSIRHLLAKGIRIEEIIEFTDHCSSQYKSKTAFFLLSNLKIPLCRHYFGVKHGKGPSDRAGAHYKNFVRKTVKSGKRFMTSCSDLAKYSQEEYDHQIECDEDRNDERSEHDGKRKKNPAHSLRKVIYTTTDMKKLRGKYDDEKLKAITDTRLIHSIRNTGVAAVLEFRNMDCCCTACITGQGECSYKEYADVWSKAGIKVGITKKKLREMDTNKIVKWRARKTKNVKKILKPRRDENIEHVIRKTEDHENKTQAENPKKGGTRQSARIRRDENIEHVIRKTEDHENKTQAENPKKGGTR